MSTSIPVTESVSELAAFWDVHEVTEFSDELAEVSDPVFAQRINLRVGAEVATYKVVIERDSDTGLYVGHVPGWSGAHSQGATREELQKNLQEVIDMLIEDEAGTQRP